MDSYVWNLLFDYPEPINVAFIGNMAAATLFFVVSFAMDNSSWFDQYWAMAPVPIAYYYAFNENANWEVAGTRKILALAALTIWAIRLFSLYFAKEHRENDSGGTLHLTPFQHSYTLLQILTIAYYPYYDKSRRQTWIWPRKRGRKVRAHSLAHCGLHCPEDEF